VRGMTLLDAEVRVHPTHQLPLAPWPGKAVPNLDFYAAEDDWSAVVEPCSIWVSRVFDSGSPSWFCRVRSPRVERGVSRFHSARVAVSPAPDGAGRPHRAGAPSTGVAGQRYAAGGCASVIRCGVEKDQRRRQSVGA